MSRDRPLEPRPRLARLHGTPHPPGAEIEGIIRAAQWEVKRVRRCLWDWGVVLIDSPFGVVAAIRLAPVWISPVLMFKLWLARQRRMRNGG